MPTDPRPQKPDWPFPRPSDERLELPLSPACGFRNRLWRCGGMFFFQYYNDAREQWEGAMTYLPEWIMDIFAALLCAEAWRDEAEEHARERALLGAYSGAFGWHFDCQWHEAHVENCQRNAKKCRAWERAQAEKAGGGE